MKKCCITVLIITIIILSAMAIEPLQTPKKEYLRIHIRADSNEAPAQTVKYKVKDAVVEYLIPFIAECKTKEQAKTMLSERLEEVERVADSVLLSNGYDYTAKARLGAEEFPTRVYDSLTLEQGIYDALIIELGKGEGANWWCVVYPPLCFTGGEQTVYKSKILEIINSFKSKT